MNWNIPGKTLSFNKTSILCSPGTLGVKEISNLFFPTPESGLLVITGVIVLPFGALTTTLTYKFKLWLLEIFNQWLYQQVKKDEIKSE
jgi:hypothetical protein